VNVLLISIDTLSAKHLGCYGYTRNTSPNLDRLASQGVLFTQCLCAQVPTQPSYTTVYTGQYSITHGIVTHGGTRQLAHDAPFFTYNLQNDGFVTACVSNLLRMQPWFTRGYEFIIDPSFRWKFFQAQSCEAVNDRAIPWIKQHADESFFLFVHYWDPHTPYLPPERYRGLFYDGDPCDPSKHTMEPLWGQYFGQWWQRDWFEKLIPGKRITDAEYIVAMYDSEIRYVDEMGIDPLLAALDEAGLTDDTLVIVFSDHGEMMYQHGIFFDHHGLYDENLHVPLIVRWPGRAIQGARIPFLALHVDLAPTILEACGCPIPPKMEGHSLVPLITGNTDQPVRLDVLHTQECTWQAKWVIRADDYKLIKKRGDEPDLHGMPPRELYHLPTDPDELHNIVDQEPDVADDLDRRLEAWIAEMMERNGLRQDPLVEQGITLGRLWHNWIQEKRYW
jgi:arylsulfatase A-like enzyme